jgi:hypothetical protein
LRDVPNREEQLEIRGDEMTRLDSQRDEAQIEAMSVQERTQAAEAVLDRLLDWVSKTDTKFALLVGIDTAMLGTLSGFASAARTLSGAHIFVAALAAILLLLSLLAVGIGTYPRTRGPEGSLIYFGCIARKGTYEFKERFRSRTPNQHLDDVLEQVHRNSEIVDRKFGALRWAYYTLLASVIPWAVALYSLGAFTTPGG